MTKQADVLDDPKYKPILDHGFVGLIDVMGSDADIAQAARCSYGKGTKSVSEDRSLIRYLIRHQHTSPIEMVELKFHLKIPIFVMRQHVRHRTASLNEYSGRYSEMTDEMYLPEPERLQKQSTSNKQGSGDELSNQEKAFCENLLQQSYDKSYFNYKNTLQLGLSRELSRIQLPVANYTELYWKIDLKNFFHYTKLRTDPHAQYEIRVLADAMYELVKPYVPIACEAFEDYWMNAKSFSSMELEFLRYIFDRVKQQQLIYNVNSCFTDWIKANNENKKWSEREINEFREKFGLTSPEK